MNNTDGTQSKIDIDENDISWKYDRETFKNTANIDKQWWNHSDGAFFLMIFFLMTT